MQRDCRRRTGTSVGSLAKGNGNVESQVISGTGLLKESRESQNHRTGHCAAGGRSDQRVEGDFIAVRQSG